MIATPEQHRDAFVAALTAVQAHPQALEAVPASPTAFYTEVVSVRRYGGTERLSGERNTTDLYRVVLRQVAREEVNAYRLRAKASAIEGTTITVNSAVSTPIDFETEEPIGPDDGWYSGAQSWTYCL